MHVELLELYMLFSYRPTDRWIELFTCPPEFLPVWDGRTGGFHHPWYNHIHFQIQSHYSITLTTSSFPFPYDISFVIIVMTYNVVLFFRLLFLIWMVSLWWLSVLLHENKRLYNRNPFSLNTKVSITGCLMSAILRRTKEISHYLMRFLSS